MKSPLTRRTLLARGGHAAMAGTSTSLLPGCASWAPTLADDASDVALLNRLSWGIDSASLDALQRGPHRDYLQAQLHPPATPDLPAAVQARVASLEHLQKPMLERVAEVEQRSREANAIKDEDQRRAAQTAHNQALNRLARDAALHTLWINLYSPWQLQAQLAWFWTNHFSVYQYKGGLQAMVGDFDATLRPLALGRFEDLLLASTSHVAMLRYLDNERNVGNRGNENLARELLELHSLGAHGGYAQADVQAMAKLLTGLGSNFSPAGSTPVPALTPAQQPLYLRRGAMEFHPARHDATPQQFLGQAVAGAGWPALIGQLQRVARHPATARHISHKLAQYLAAERPPPTLVARMAQAYSASDGHIGATLQAMFSAPEFTPTLGTLFKDPMHCVVSAVRLAYDGKTLLNPVPMLNWLSRLGEAPFNRATPDGYPLDEAAWSSSGQMAARFEVARAIGGGPAGLFRTEAQPPEEQPAFPQLSNALYHRALAARLGPATRAALDGATSPQQWNALLLSSPEFMRR